MVDLDFGFQQSLMLKISQPLGFSRQQNNVGLVFVVVIVVLVVVLVEFH